MSAHPLAAIWLKPRHTVRELSRSNPKYLVIFLSVLSGIYQAFTRASNRTIGDSLDLSTILLLCIIGGGIGGVLYLYFGSAILRMSAGWLGGKASPEEVRLAFSWSTVPTIVSLLLWIPMLAIFGHEMFTTASPILQSHISYAILWIAVSLIELLLFGWSLILLVVTLQEVNEFSFWRSAGSVLLAVVVAIALAFVLGACYAVSQGIYFE